MGSSLYFIMRRLHCPSCCRTVFLHPFAIPLLYCWRRMSAANP